MPTLKVILRDDEQKALAQLAARELRDPRAQALLVIRRELERAGLLADKLAATVAGKGGDDAKA